MAKIISHLIFIFFGANNPNQLDDKTKTNEQNLHYDKSIVEWGWYVDIDD